MELTRDQIIKLVGNRIFHVKFRKRSTGEVRLMNCRLHVRKGVKGVDKGRKERDRNNEVLTVYEMPGGFKCIPIDGILELRV